MVDNRVHPAEEPGEGNVAHDKPARRRRQIEEPARAGEKHGAAADPGEGSLYDSIEPGRLAVHHASESQEDDFAWRVEESLQFLQNRRVLLLIEPPGTGDDDLRRPIRRPRQQPAREAVEAGKSFRGEKTNRTGRESHNL